MNRKQIYCTVVLTAVVTATGAQQVQTQQQAPPAQPSAQAPSSAPRGGWPGAMDEDRARQLYVSNDHADHGRGVDFARQVEQKADDDKRYAQVTKGVVDFQKVSYRSSVGDMDIPAYLFQPLNKRGAKGHAAMVWVHGGVHGNWGITMWPFVKRGGRTRLRRDLSRVSRQHRLRREALQGDRLRRVRDGRRDERGRLLEDAAARRSRTASA